MRQIRTMNLMGRKQNVWTYLHSFRSNLLVCRYNFETQMEFKYLGFRIDKTNILNFK